MRVTVFCGVHVFVAYQSIHVLAALKPVHAHDELLDGVSRSGIPIGRRAVGSGGCTCMLRS